MVAALAVLGAAGGVLAGLSPLSTSIAVGCVVTSAAGIRLNTETSLAITAGTVAAFLAAGLTVGAPAETLLGYLTKDATRAEIGRAVLAAAAGQSNREIARALFVSEATVKTHVNRIFAKTGSRDRVRQCAMPTLTGTRNHRHRPELQRYGSPGG
jgi:hypothetical protein